MCQNQETGLFDLVGSISFGYKCGETFGIYGKVQSAIPWIKSTVYDLPQFRVQILNKICLTTLKMIIKILTMYPEGFVDLNIIPLRS